MKFIYLNIRVIQLLRTDQTFVGNVGMCVDDAKWMCAIGRLSLMSLPNY